MSGHRWGRGRTASAPGESPFDAASADAANQRARHELRMRWLAHLRIGLAMLLALGAAPVAAAEPKTANIPEVDAALNRPVTDDPLDLLPAWRLLWAAGMTAEAEAVSLLLERNTLLKLTGGHFPSGAPLKTAMQRVTPSSRPDATLRAAVLSAVHVELSPLLAREEPLKHQGAMPQGMSAAGGAWIRQIHVDERAIWVPVQLEYTGTVGQVGGVVAELLLVPLHGGRTIALQAIDRGFSNIRWKHGERFWRRAVALRPQRLTAAELIDALQGLADKTYRLETSVHLLWVTPSEDPRSPLMILGADRADRAQRAATWHDPYGRVPTPVFDRSNAAAVLQSRTPQGRCIAAAERSPAPALGAERPAPASTASDRLATAGTSGERAVPLDSPLLRRALAGPLPERPSQLLDTVALLTEAHHPAEARALAAFVEHAVLLELLGRPFEPFGTVATLLAASPGAGADLVALRECVISSAIGVELPELDSSQAASAGLGAPFFREGGNVWSRDLGGRRTLFVPMQIANLTRGWLYQIEFTARLEPRAPSEELMLLVSRTGGGPIGPGQRNAMTAFVDPRSAPLDAASLDAIVDAARRGDYRIERADWSLQFGSAPRFRLSSSRLAWDGQDAREASARQTLEAASCSDTAGCFASRSGTGLSNPLGWIAAECLAALTAGAFFARRLRTRFLPAVAYVVFFLLTLGAAGLVVIDRPSGVGMGGVLSIGSAFMLGLPWNLALANHIGGHGVLRSFFTDADAELIVSWLGVVINQLLLGLLTLWRKGATAG